MTDNDEDPLVFLEKKKAQLAALAEVQRLAEEQAQMAFKLQKRMRDLEAMAGGAVECSPSNATGLLDDNSSDGSLGSRALTLPCRPVGASSGESRRFSSLSEDDRIRFGLDVGVCSSSGEQQAPFTAALDISSPTDCRGEDERDAGMQQTYSQTYSFSPNCRRSPPFRPR